MTSEGRFLHPASLATLIVALTLTIGVHSAWAQFGPFGGPRPPMVGGIVGWVFVKQAMFYRALAGMIRLAKSDGSALWGLMGLLFVYGIFHAAGPGHGKAVISSHLLANEETWRRGITLSFASAVMQSLTAVTIVGVAAVLLGATAKFMGDTVRVIELVSYGLIVLVGARLLWVKGLGFVRAWRDLKTVPEKASFCGCTDQRQRLASNKPPDQVYRCDQADADARIHHAAACEHQDHNHDEEPDLFPWDTPMGPNRKNLPGQVAGAAAGRRFWPWACVPAPARSSCSSSRSPKACSGQEWRRPL